MNQTNLRGLNVGVSLAPAEAEVSSEDVASAALTNAAVTTATTTIILADLTFLRVRTVLLQTAKKLRPYKAAKRFWELQEAELLQTSTVDLHSCASSDYAFRSALAPTTLELSRKTSRKIN